MLCLLLSAISFAFSTWVRPGVTPFGGGRAVERVVGWGVFGVLAGVPLGVGLRSVRPLGRLRRRVLTGGIHEVFFCFCTNTVLII